MLFEGPGAARFACVSFSPDSSCIDISSVDGTNETIRIWNARTWTTEHEISFQEAEDHSYIVFYPNGKYILSSSGGGILQQWDIKSGKCVGKSPRIDSGVQRIAFTADGNRIFSGSSTGVVRIWDAELGTKSQQEMYGHSGGTWEAARCDDGLRVASASSDKTIRLWDVRTGKQLGVPLEGHASIVCCV